MKKVLLLLVTCLAINFSWAEEIIQTEYYENGNLKLELEAFNPGTEFAYYVLKKWYRSGSLMETGTYDEHGQKQGAWTIYHESGKIFRIRHFDKGDLHGKYTVFNEDSDIILEINFRRGARHGEAKAWDRVSGELVVHRVYKRGRVLESYEITPMGGLLIVQH